MKKTSILPPNVELPAALSRDSEMDKMYKGYRWKVITNFPKVHIAWFKSYTKAIAYYKYRADRILN